MFDDLGQLEFRLLDWHEESGSGSLETSLNRSNSTWSRCAGSCGATGSCRACRSGGESEHVDDLLGRVVLASPEDVRFRAIGESEFVDLGHGAESDQPDEGVGREQAETDDDGFLECLEIFFI